MKQLYFQFSSFKNSKTNTKNLIIADFNQLAYDTLCRLDDSTNKVLYISGEPKVGKTSLVIKSLQNHQAIELKQSDSVNTLILQQYMKDKKLSTILIDNLLPLTLLEENNLFNLYNFVLSYGYKLIFTSRYSLEDLKITLPDLSSRMSSSLVLRIKNPDDDNLEKIFFLLLQQRQIVVSIKVVKVILNNIERTMSSIVAVIDRMEDYINVNKKAINLKNIKNILFY